MSELTPWVVCFGAMGDMVLMIPVLKLLQRRYGRPCELISSGPWTSPLMQRVPACGTIHLLASRRMPYWFSPSQWRLVDALRRRPPGPVYVVADDEKTHELIRRGNVEVDWICTLKELPRRPGEHFLAWALRLARNTPPALQGRSDLASDGLPDPDTRPVITEDDRRDCEDWLQRNQLAGPPLVLLQPGNKRTMRRGRRQRSSNLMYWAESNWGEVISGIRRTLPDGRIILCGSPTERNLAEDILGCVSGPRDGILIASGELPIPRLLALQERAHSMISINTGPAHSAAAMGCPLVALFTRHLHRSVDLYGPRTTTAPAKIVLPESTAPDADLSTVTAEAVLSTWRELIQEIGRRRPEEEIRTRIS